MAEIRFISTCMVQPTNQKGATRRIELTPWDLNFLFCDSIQKGLLFHKPTPQQQTSLIDHLKTSLSRTLDFFYPLAGRLGITENDDKTTSFFINCNGAGAEFIHAAVDGVTVADILEAVYTPPVVLSFFPMNGTWNCEGVSKPLFAVQVTELVDGIFIGCHGNHSVLDGTTFWRFFNSWSEISRGSSDHISKLPVYERWFFDGTECPIRIPISYHEELLTKFTDKPLQPLFQERVFHFTREKIAALKAKANAEMGTNRISSLQSILGHLWLGVLRSKRLHGDEEVKYGLIIGTRQRVDPPLPEEYLGNACLTAITTATAGELLQHGLGRTAWKLNSAIASYTGEEVKHLWENWVKNPKFTKVSKLANSNILVTGSSPRFNVFGNDFGWGRPVAVRSGVGNKLDGKLTVFPGAEEGSVDVEAALLPETLQAMAKDTEFMEAFN